MRRAGVPEGAIQNAMNRDNVGDFSKNLEGSATSGKAGSKTGSKPKGSKKEKRGKKKEKKQKKQKQKKGKAKKSTTKKSSAVESVKSREAPSKVGNGQNLKAEIELVLLNRGKIE